MKKLIILGLAVLVAASTAVAGGKGTKGNTVFKVDAASSKLKWVGKKVTGEHFGYLSFKTGEVVYNGTAVTGGKAVVDMNTMTCTDIENKEYADKLVGHLKNADFFDVEKFSTSEFTLGTITPIAGAKDGENNYNVKGTLTIKGVSNAIEFPARVEINGATLVLRADITFDRTKFGIKYGSASVIEGIGDKAIHDEVLFSLALVARAAK